MKNWKLPKLLNTPFGLMLALGSIIAAVELLIMLVILPKIIPEKLSYPRQSRGFIFVSPSKGQKREAPEGAESHTQLELVVMS
ncbi:MAG: hypothetical protein WC091_14210, partial [Sulfuricellaceae bacterium]